MWFLKLLLVGLLAVVLRHAAKMVDNLGIYRTVRTHWPGPCRNVNPIHTGSEKVVVTKDGLTFITSGLIAEYRGEIVDSRMKNFEGKIYLFDFNKPDEDAKVIEISEKFEFMPHGMGMLEDKNTGEIRLFIVNHREEAETVEIMVYDRNANKLQYIKSIRDPLFTSMNDVVPTGLHSFYISNDGYHRNSSLRIPERLLSLPWGSLVYFDGTHARNVVDRAFEPNGIDLSFDKHTLFVCMPFLQSIHIYKRLNDNSLELTNDLAINVACDNVYVHPKTGHLWFGTLPMPYKVVVAAANIDEIAPAVVCRLEARGPPTDIYQSFQLYEVFADDTGLLSTSSSAIEYDGKLLISSIFHKLAFCEMETKY